MKNIVLFILFISSIALGQIPAGYYNSANGLTGYPLKTELSNIITNGYSAQSYNSLITLYNTSDNDEYYDNGTQTNTLIDMYSENPTGADPYNWIIGTSSNCGNYNSEADCYNREHIFPQGFFSQNEPMRSDAHHVIPTDGFVNGGRGSLPFGNVNPNGASITTYMNGSRRGPSITTGFNGTVFEPIDEFKGDIARMLLYFATRYESNINDSGWDAANASANNPRDGSSDQFYEQWYVDLLLDWHAQDPVSQKEIDRNNDIYVHQNNRNPYIDNPSYVTMIWTASTNTGNGSLFPTLSGNYIDINTNSLVDAGDEIQYTYSIANIGTTTMYNLRATSPLGSFNPGNQLASLAAGQTVNNPFGTFTYVLTAADASNGCGCITNQLLLAADYNAAGTTGTLNVASDDPNNFTNNDSDGDNLPDDFTIVTYPNGGSGAAGDLFISEYIEGSGTNKAIEIANFTGAPVDLSNYTLEISQNGSGSWTLPLSLSGTLADQDVYVLARGNANSAILAQADLLVGNGGPLDFNGNDAVGLFRAGTLLDIVGDNNSSNTFAANETLVRKSSVTSPNVVFDKVGEWDVFAQDDSSDLGMHTFGGTASIEDNMLLNLSVYPNPSSGRFDFNNDYLVEEVRVYDVAGRQIQSNYTHNEGLVIDRPGVYFINVSYQGQSKTFKVFVQ
ncbi:MAG: endonuclease [Nonlabens sp.]|uniref:endonuclease n=1 Tax=Nonlabens sp. TaxID=1888209 RepID=UPI003EF6819B